MKRTKTFTHILSLALAMPLCMGSLCTAQEETTDPASEAPAADKADKKAQKKSDKKADKNKKKADEGNYISQSIPGWGNPDSAQRSLAGSIMNALKGDTPEHVLKFIESPKNRLMVAQYMLAQYDKTVVHLLRHSQKLVSAILKFFRILLNIVVHDFCCL
jgi:hypothetical protein